VNQDEKRIVSREPSWCEKKNRTRHEARQRALLLEIQDARASRTRKPNKNRHTLRAGQETVDRKINEELSRDNQHKDWREDQIIREDRDSNHQTGT
jgi:thioesterase domain-containing protein